ncbi:MAG: response regulator transcription factor [Pirellulales bacterium]|nr:response regulator transcription factor [Pirellulales bacterium]
MTSTEPTVFVVDDDDQARESICALATSMNVRSESFSSAEDFLHSYENDRPGCLVSDLRLPGMSGLELLTRLRERNITLPTVLLTAYARTPVTVEAMKKGALTILDKPYHDDDLWQAIREALAEDASRRNERQWRQDVHARLARLNAAERDVLERILEGKPNKVIAQELAVSVRTVENRRHDILVKMRAGSVAELVRMVVQSGDDPASVRTRPPQD